MIATVLRTIAGPLIRNLSARALYPMAMVWRTLLFRTTFIAVTGSVGKTTAKECLAAILSSRLLEEALHKKNHLRFLQRTRRERGRPPQDARYTTAGRRLSFPKAQWKTLRTTNVVERLNEEFRRCVKTQGSLRAKTPLSSYSSAS